MLKYVGLINKGNKISVFNKKLVPYLTYNATKDCFVLHFQAPNNYGAQKFEFDGNLFCIAKNYKMDLKQAGLIPQNAELVYFIFNAFSITPTILKKVYKLKNGKGLKLQFKKSFLLKHT